MKYTKVNNEPEVFITDYSNYKYNQSDLLSQRDHFDKLFEEYYLNVSLIEKKKSAQSSAVCKIFWKLEKCCRLYCIFETR